MNHCVVPLSVNLIIFNFRKYIVSLIHLVKQVGDCFQQSRMIFLAIKYVNNFSSLGFNGTLSVGRDYSLKDL